MLSTKFFLCYAVWICIAVTLFAVEPKVVTVDVCIYGGTSGGVTAGIQVARMGKSAVILEPGKHLGGMTASGLGYVDMGKPGTIGGIARESFTKLAAKHGREISWDNQPETIRMTTEPHIAEQFFNDMVGESKVSVYFDARLASVKNEKAKIVEISCEDGMIVRAKMFIDATYEGDLLAKAGVSYTLEREGNAKYGESFNGIIFHDRWMPKKSYAMPRKNGRLPDGLGAWDRDFFLDPYVVPGDPKSGLLPLVQESESAEPGKPAPGIMAYCYRLCLTNNPANRITIKPPKDYDAKKYELVARFIAACKANGDDMDLRWFSKYDRLPNDKWDFNTATFGGNLPGASWEWPEATYQRREEIAKIHENYHRGLLHFLATDQRVPKKVRDQMKTFGLCKDEFPDNGGWPHQIYVREGRRMVSDLVMTEHHVYGKEIAPQSVGIGSYGTDIHEIRRIVKDGVVVREGKFGHRTVANPIGYGAIVPREAECENMFVTFAVSSSHVAYGSLRMEPQHMILSESAATAACLAIDGNVSVQKLDYSKLKKKLLADKQLLLPVVQ